MGSVIAIDPGKRTGWALFEAGKLFYAQTSTVETLSRNVGWQYANAPVVDVVIEVPRIYPRGGKGDPNDLIDLAVLVGDLRGYYRRQGFTVELVWPRTWKGTVPKKIHNARTVAKLTPVEVELLPKRPRAKDYDHNMLDAVGLGLWWLEKEGERG